MLRFAQALAERRIGVSWDMVGSGRATMDVQVGSGKLLIYPRVCSGEFGLFDYPRVGLGSVRWSGAVDVW